MYCFSARAFLPLYLFFKKIAMLIYLVRKNTQGVCLFAFLFLFYYAGFSQTMKKTSLLPAFNQQIDFQSASAADIKETTSKAISDANTDLKKIYAVPNGKHNFKNTLQ